MGADHPVMAIPDLLGAVATEEVAAVEHEGPIVRTGSVDPPGPRGTDLVATEVALLASHVVPRPALVTRPTRPPGRGDTARVAAPLEVDGHLRSVKQERGRSQLTSHGGGTACVPVHRVRSLEERGHLDGHVEVAKHGLERVGTSGDCGADC